jgi:predicted type IV restriction endonuclease
MTKIVIFSIIIAGVNWVILDAYKESNKQKNINIKLFSRTWKHEQFLMEIYKKCPKEIQNKIEEYLKGVEPL